MQDDWSHSVDDVDRDKDCYNKDDRDGLPHVDCDLDESVQAFHNFLCFIQALSRTVAFPSLIAYLVVRAGLAYFLVHICGLSAFLSYLNYLNGDRRSIIKKSGCYGYLENLHRHLSTSLSRSRL